MSQAIQKLTSQKDPYLNADTVNSHGFKAFTRSIEEQYVQLLATNTLGGTYYFTQNALVKGTVELHEKMRDHDPRFMAQAIYYNRNTAFMRTQSIVGLAYLSTVSENYFETLFEHVIRTPNDLVAFVELVKNGDVRKGMGRRVKRVINQWLINISDYHLIKYGSDNKGFSLKDVMLLTHPKSASPRWNTIANYLLGNLEVVNWELIPQVRLFHELKENADNEARVIEIIKSGKLPHEVVTGVVKPTQAIWSAIASQMPTFAYLRHLKTLHKANALDQKDFASRMTPDAIKKARILPMRLYSAFDVIRDLGITQAKNSLSLCLDATADALPELQGNIIFALDNSPSMEAKISEHSTLSCLNVGSLLLGLFARKNVSARYVVFSSGHAYSSHNSRGVMELDIKPNTPALTVVDQVKGLPSNGTDLALPVRFALEKNMACDLFIGFTDSEDWAGAGFLTAWRDFKKARPKTRAVLVQLAPNKALSAPQEMEDVTYVYGWHDSLFEAIVNQDKPQVDIIRAIDLYHLPE